MRWPFAPLTLALALAVAPRAGAVDEPRSATKLPATGATGTAVTLGTGPAYEAFGRLPMMHEGRVKPLDTVAREEIKTITKRETIRLPARDGQPAQTWTHLGAFLDWSARPRFWDEQPIILVEYLPLKRLMFAEEAHEALEAVASKSGTPAATRDRLRELARFQEVEPSELRNVVRDSGLPAEDGKSLLALAAKIGEETKYFSPDDLINAQMVIAGKPTPFVVWIDALVKKRGEGGSAMGGKSALNDVEQKALKVAEALARYRAIRDKDVPGMVQLLVMPRPSNDAMIRATAAAVAKGRDGKEQDLTDLDKEMLESLQKYFKDIPGKDRALPGTSPDFDARYKAWAVDRSAWVPLHVLRTATLDELVAAGFPREQTESYRQSWDAVDRAEKAQPGQLADDSTTKLVDSAHALGSVVNDSVYPSVAAMVRETHFNDSAPFFKAPWAYLAGLLMLVAGASSGQFGRAIRLERGFNVVAKGCYLLGVLGLTAGIGLEAYGFYLRVGITGRAPVTNMYETVIFVAMVASILGLIFEGISHKTVAAAGGACAGLIGTSLAANVSLLDPTISTLTPVLRDNFWLMVHVLTIVSSYAPFTLAMVLGLIATAIYLTATYKRTASFAELLSPLAGGIPILGVGLGLMQFANGLPAGTFGGIYGFYTAVGVASLGGVLMATALFATLGEMINRPILARQLASAADRDGDIRARLMQSTAMLLKPIANFIYRLMQVGVLLVAAGTFLGGWWADKSWGRFWGWDPKEVWALITLLVYLMPLHGRFAGWVNTFWLVMSSLACFSSVLMAWYGVNFVLGVGLHSYGFGSGDGNYGQLTVGAVTLGVLSFAAGSFWRRRVSSRVVEPATDVA